MARCVVALAVFQDFQDKPVRKVLPACLLASMMGCQATVPRPATYRAAAPPGPPPAAVVFIANGAGDSRTVSENLTRVVAEAGAPLQIETVIWSRGFRRAVADQMDHDNHLAYGRQLALQAAAYRRAYPERRIYFIGQSAGGAVVLAAAEQLPPDSVDRIILLAPSVCRSYDLRPALLSSRRGIDVFYSSEDRWILGLGMKVFGTTEGACRTAAGRTGFTPVITSPADQALYAKLRQHAWHPAVEWSGNDGGHFGSSEAGFLRAYVLPLLAVMP